MLPGVLGVDGGAGRVDWIVGIFVMGEWGIAASSAGLGSVGPVLNVNFDRRVEFCRST
jgi:hypothetical protein